ncbi:uncharacterized protein APUU_22061S [Aspergillus puulaauensis]|uniref:N-acetylglucosaminylphosphatidylinositol deacetylase n=1 Tax=Aspergillus puulaauensis TaxID=1220207 RepID=A0A7R7XJ84_9EURO|nr:uncharacterized protein APUU_22061S [Aspergillus puulaauensis]BCS21629.1 hypothetical protein APUU_22061S [Aspergillus puulaauensis]
MYFRPFITSLGLLVLTDSLAAADRALNFAAHQDDDLLFINAQIIHDIDLQNEVRTVFVTAGDAGNGPDYWTSRQAGTLAAYAEMAGVGNDWDESDLGVPGKVVSLYNLRNTDVSVAFLHLPDGNNDGSGFPATGNESMEKLWKGAIDSIGTVDESGSSYTYDELVDSLAWIINDYTPDRINALNYIDDFGAVGDHSDHTSSALFANEGAINAENFPGDVIGYIGYDSQTLEANLSAEDLQKKKDAFYTYAGFDSAACASDEACAGTEYELWLQREYPRN